MNRRSDAIRSLGRLEAEHGDMASAFDHLGLAIRHMHDSGDTSDTPLAALAALLTGSDATRWRPPSPVSHSAPHRGRYPQIDTAIAHLREVLGDPTYESLARKGETMTTAEMVTYAYDQIDQARAELNTVSK